MMFIPGMFDFEDLYQRAADKFDNCTFIEIGAWQGSSTIYMANAIKDKNIRFITIDTFEGDLNAPHQHKALTQETQFDSFVYNTQRAGFKFYDYESDPTQKLTYFKGDSRKCLPKVTNDDVRFIFLDGSHKYDVVKSELQTSLELINAPGVLGGHDYDLRPCRKAVNERMSLDKIEIYIGRNVLSWWVEL